MNNLFRKTKTERGAILLLIMGMFVVLIPLIQGVWLDSQLEYNFKKQRMNALQARYNANSGLGLSILRVYIFKGVEHSLPQQWKSLVRPLLDRIWSFPFVWPLPVLEDDLDSEKEGLEALTKRSFFSGSYYTMISSEDGLLDINDLSSSLTPLRELTYNALLSLLLEAVEEKKSLKDKYDIKDLERILNNLSDWTDLDDNSQNGGSESLIEEGVKPLNRSFASIDEVKKTPGLNKELFQILEPHITVYGTKALNINYANFKILKAIGLPEEWAEQVLMRTQSDSENYNPFSSKKDFCSFLDDLGLAFCDNFKETYQTLDILSLAHPLSFRIRSRGGYRKNFINLESVLFDLSSVALNYQKAGYYEIQRQRQKEDTGNPSSPESSFEEKEEKNLTQKLKFDYSFSKSLIIMYVKENI